MLFGLIDAVIGATISSVLIYKDAKPYVWVLLHWSPFFLPIGALLFFMWMTALTHMPTNDNVNLTFTIAAASIIISVILQITAVIIKRIPASTLQFVAIIIVLAGITSGSIIIFGFMISKDTFLHKQKLRIHPHPNLV